jgi:hypothetical protein
MKTAITVVLLLPLGEVLYGLLLERIRCNGYAGLQSGGVAWRRLSRHRCRTLPNTLVVEDPTPILLVELFPQMLLESLLMQFGVAEV